MHTCPVCDIYGDVWHVRFPALGNLEALMCLECDSVWCISGEKKGCTVTFESLCAKYGQLPDWTKIEKIGRKWDLCE